MSGLTGVIAGFAVVAGAVALYRLLEGRIEAARAAMSGRDGDAAPVIDFEQDPVTGVFRAK
ncbi:MAG: hypothetical protein K2Q06_09055 [Parvularculaceae bacterium]|nr:hypothetical protein [Parvularculaceae bacterium]